MQPDFPTFALDFFAQLGYASPLQFQQSLTLVDAVEALELAPTDITRRALDDDEARVHLLFQFTAEQLKQSNSLFAAQPDRDLYEAFVFLALDLREGNYSRSDVAALARQFNQPFASPVIVLLRHGQTLSLASVARRLNLNDNDKHVLQKVSMLKDIGIDNPHRAHAEILKELAGAKTGAHNWAEFLARWNAVLDISELNRKFYRDYKLVFEAVEKQVRGIEADAPAAKAKLVRDWTQRLFNRLLFLRFLEKKGWLEFDGSPDYLRALWEAPRAAGETFLKDRLYWTFFHGLNMQGEQRDIHATPELVAKRGQVPFLNGGLFEVQDELDVKDAVWFGDEELVWNSILGLFERYVFTVAENTPLEEEVGVDPEMLGKVFEELTNERTESGSYYTPRVVVSFMAREAIKGYLRQCDNPRAIEAFVEESDASGISKPEKVLEALKAVRICDPACGSGAYLLGAMQELLRLRESLFAAHKVDPLEQYDRKLEIIERNLYGADLTKFAVQIAMLRLWLSLVVDFNGDVKQLPALPNLQYKIGEGDSLTAPDPTDKGKVYHAAYLPLAQQLASLQNEWFEESYRRSKGEITRPKSQIKADIDAKTAEIRGKIGKAPDEAHDWRLRFAEVFAQGGFDIVIANPPYGASVENATRDLYFAGGQGQSKDTYGLFMARGLQLLRPGGWFTFIVSDTWRTIKSHKPLRRRLLENANVAHVLDLPAWIFGATVNTGILTFQKAAPGADDELIAADLRALQANDWNGLAMQLRDVAALGDDRQTKEIARYSYPQSLIGTYENASFFIAAPALYKLMSDPKRFEPLGKVADVPQGISTGQNKYYVRRDEAGEGYEAVNHSLVMREDEIAGLSQDEKLNGVASAKYSGRYFIPFDKGGESDSDEGWMPNYYVPTQYFIDWSRASLARMRTLTIAGRKQEEGKTDKIKVGDSEKLAAAMRNPKSWFKPAITFSPTGVYSPTFRIGGGGIFQNTGSGIICEKIPIGQLLGVLTSLFARYLLKNYLNHTIHTQEGDLSSFPFPRLNSVKATELESLVASIIEKQKLEPRYAYWLDEGPQIDALVYALYGLDDAAIAEVERWYCRRYPRLARAQGVWDRVAASASAIAATSSE